MPSVTINERAWKYHVVPAIAVGARAEGDAPPQPPKSGISFTSDKGEIRFLPMGYPDLPSQKQLEAMPLSQVVELFNRAR